MDSAKLARSLAYWSTIIVTAILPFFFIPAPWASIAHAKVLLVVVFVVIATISWITAAFLEGSFRMPRSSLFFAVLLVPAAYLISALATGATRASFIGEGAEQDTVAAVLIWYALFVACANVLSAGSGRRLTAAVKALVAGGAVVLLIQFFRLLIPSFTFGDSLVAQTASVIGSWHDLGIFLGLLFFLSLALLPTTVAANRLWKFLLIAISIFSLLLLLVVNFRDVWMSLVILSAGYGAYLWYSSRGSGQEARSPLIRRALTWLVLSLVFLGLYFGSSAIQGVLPSAFQVTQLEVRPSWQGTLSIGSGVFSQPGSVFFGSGPNTFPLEWGMYKPLSVNATQFWNVDFYSGVGFIPTSFVTVGLLGVIAWGAVCLALLLSLRRIIRERAELLGIHLLRSTLIAGAAYLTVFHVLYVPGQMLSALTFILFGAIVAGEILAGSARHITLSLTLEGWKGWTGLGILTAFALVVLVTGIQTGRAVISDMFVNRSVTVYAATQDLARASDQASAALSVLPSNDRAHRAAIEIGLLQLAQLTASGDVSEEARTELQNTLNTTIQHGLTAVAIEIRNYQNWLALARLYGELAGAGVAGAEEGARAAYEEARKSNPTNPLPLLGLAQLELLAGNDAPAREHLTAAIGIKPDFAAAYFLLSQIDARAGDLEAARGSAEAVAQIAPNDPLGWYNLGTIYYAEGNYENAGAALEQAVGLQNDYANALFLLSASYANLALFENAIAALQAVAALNPSETSLQNMLTSLEEGENPFTTSEAE